MGQAKHNPTAIAAKKGELSPKPQKMSKREQDRMIATMIKVKMAEKTGLPAELFKRCVLKGDY